MHEKLTSLLEHCTLGPMALSPEWHALRKFDAKRNPPVVLGASLAGAVCGLSPYTMALEVFMRQLDLLPPVEVTAAMEDGNDFELPALKKWARRRGYEIETGLPMFLSKKWPWMAATPDAIALTDPLRGGDAKVPSFRRYDEFGIDPNKYGEEETDHLPTDNIMQAQQQMAVLGLNIIEFPVLFDIRTLRIYVVHREQALIDMIVSAGEEMVQRIINNDPPEPDFVHKNAANVIRELHGLVTGKTVTLDEESIKEWNELNKIKDDMKVMKARADAIKAKVLHQIGDAEAGLFPRGTKQIKRIVVRDTLWTDDDLAYVQAHVGALKKQGHERLQETKVKESK